MYKGIHKNGAYLYLYLPTHPKAHGAKKLYYPLHKLVYEWKMNLKSVPEGFVIHHINGDTLDNNPENLKALTVSEHNSLTANNRKRDKYGKLK